MRAGSWHRAPAAALSNISNAQSLPCHSSMLSVPVAAPASVKRLLGSKQQQFKSAASSWPPGKGARLLAQRASTAANPASQLMQNAGLETSADTHAAMALEEAPTWTWQAQWWPVVPVKQADRCRPTRHVIAGKQLVVWYSKGTDRWNAFEDKCPHRLAPLSQGRIIGDDLVCSYHGWTFNDSGSCTGIPQLQDAAQPQACADRRACALSYPARVQRGMLYVWLDASTEGLAAAQAKQPAFCSDIADDAEWFMFEMPQDYQHTLQQVYDPSHASSLHARRGHRPQDVVPMVTFGIPVVDAASGFVHEHGGYEKRNEGMHLSRRFVPPCHVFTTQQLSSATVVVESTCVPVTPGFTRMAARFALLPAGSAPTIVSDAQAPPPICSPEGDRPATSQAARASMAPKQQSKLSPLLQVASLLQKRVPHWVYTNLRMQDEDSVMTSEQERIMFREGLTSADYYLPALGADAGVMAVNKWMRKVGYPHSLFPNTPHPATQDVPGAAPLARILQRGPSHLDFCTICQQGMRLVTKACWAVSLVAAGLAIFSVAALAASVVTSPPGTSLASSLAQRVVWATGLAGLLLSRVAQWLWDFRELKFVSGFRAWRRNGGVSLVKMPDAE